MRKTFIIVLVILASSLRLWELNKPDVYPDEVHYIVDGQRLLNRDPYTSIRHHAFRHPVPSIGHPFLAQIFTASTFKIFGLSVYTSRLPAAFAGIATVLLLLLLNYRLGGKTKYLAVIFLAIMPLAVRYTRNAQIDSVFTLMLTLAAVSVWRYLTGKNKVWLAIAGAGAALAISTKLDGVIGLVLVVLLLVFSKENIGFSKKYLKQLALELSFVLTPLILIAFLLNDPSAYLDGIINPSFNQWRFTSLEFWINRLSLTSLIAFVKVLFDLLSPLMLVAFFVSIVFSLKKIRQTTDRFLLVWLACVSGVFFVHGFTVDSSYGWIPVTAPVALLISYNINRWVYKYKYLLIWVTIAFTLPFTFIYGFRLLPIPTHGTNFAAVYNRTIDDNYYQNIITEVNSITPQKGKVFFLPQTDYPLFALRPDISWSYSNETLEKYDVLVVGDEAFVENVKGNLNFYRQFESFQDGHKLKRIIYIKS